MPSLWDVEIPVDIFGNLTDLYKQKIHVLVTDGNKNISLMLYRRSWEADVCYNEDGETSGSGNRITYDAAYSASY